MVQGRSQTAAAGSGRSRAWARAQFILALGICGAALFNAAPLAPQSSTPQFVYTADESTHNISAFQLDPTTGALTPVAGSPFNERLDPIALAVDPAGKFLFVANYKDNDVSGFQINPATGALTETPNSPFSAGNGVNPTVLATDPLGVFLYVGNSINLTPNSFGEVDVYSIDQATGALTPSVQSQNGGTIGPLGPRAIFVLPAGTSATTLYVAGGDPLQLPELVQPYAINAQTGDLAMGVALDSPEFLDTFAGDPTGHFLFLSHGENIGHIDTLTPGLVSLSEFSQGLNVGTQMITLAVDSTGQYLFTDQGSFSIAPGTGVLTPITPTQTLGYSALTADLAGPHLFTAVVGNSLIYSFQIDTTTGALTAAPGSPYATSAVPQSIAVTGRLQNPGVGFSPPSLTFPNQAVNTSSSMPIQFHNTGASSVSITGISITGTDSGDFSETNDCGSSVSAGSFCTITVTFMPIAAGQVSAAVTVMDSAPGNKQAAGLFGTAFVPAPTADVNPTSYTFPETTVGSASAAKGFTLSNNGTATLQIQSLGLGGPNPGDFTESNTCDSSVNVSSSCTITVAFQPQAVGQRTVAVNIVDNAAGSPQAISLIGTGNAPFNLTATTATTQNAQPGQPVQYGLQFVPNANFTGNVNVSCTSSPPGPQCSVSPSSFPVTNANSMPLMVKAVLQQSALLMPPMNGPAAPARDRMGTWPVTLLAFAFMALVFAQKRQLAGDGATHRLQLSRAVLAFVLGALFLGAACGGSGGGGAAPSGPQNFTLTVTATSGQASLPFNLNLVVQ